MSVSIPVFREDEVDYGLVLKLYSTNHVTLIELHKLYCHVEILTGYLISFQLPTYTLYTDNFNEYKKYFEIIEEKPTPVEDCFFWYVKIFIKLLRRNSVSRDKMLTLVDEKWATESNTFCAVERYIFILILLTRESKDDRVSKWIHRLCKDPELLMEKKIWLVTFSLRASYGVYWELTFHCVKDFAQNSTLPTFAENFFGVIEQLLPSCNLQCLFKLLDYFDVAWAKSLNIPIMEKYVDVILSVIPTVENKRMFDPTYYTWLMKQLYDLKLDFRAKIVMSCVYYFCSVPVVQLTMDRNNGIISSPMIMIETIFQPFVINEGFGDPHDKRALRKMCIYNLLAKSFPETESAQSIFRGLRTDCRARLQYL